MTELLELIRSLLGVPPVGYEFLEYIILFVPVSYTHLTLPTT